MKEIFEAIRGNCDETRVSAFEALGERTSNELLKFAVEIVEIARKYPKKTEKILSKISLQSPIADSLSETSREFIRRITAAFELAAAESEPFDAARRLFAQTDAFLRALSPTERPRFPFGGASLAGLRWELIPLSAAARGELPIAFEVAERARALGRARSAEAKRVGARGEARSVSAESRAAPLSTFWRGDAPTLSATTRRKQCLLVYGEGVRERVSALRFAEHFNALFASEGAQLRLYAPAVVLLSERLALVAIPPNNGALRSFSAESLESLYRRLFPGHFEEAQRAFLTSLAAALFARYLIAPSADFLLGADGEALCALPTLGAAATRLSLPANAVALLGGKDGPLFEYFRLLLFQAFVVARRQLSNVEAAAELLGIADDFRAKLMANVAEERLKNAVDNLIEID